MAATEDTTSPNFAHLISQLDTGGFNYDATEELKRLVQALEGAAEQDGKSKGTVTLKLTLSMDKRGLLTIIPDLQVKSPTPARPATAMWVGKEGVLHRSDPRQQKLPLHAVPAAAPPKDVEEPKQAPRSI